MYISSMRLFSIIKKFIFAFFLGLIITLLILQKQNRFKNIVKQKLQLFLQESYKCDIDFEVSNINIFFPSITLSNFTVKELHNSSWNWKCKNLRFICSWLDFIFSKKFYSTTEIYDFEGYSVYRNGNLAIWEHLQKLFAPSDIPIVLNRAEMNNASMTFYEPDLNLKGYLNWNSSSKLVCDSFKTNIYFNDGNLIKGDKFFFNKFSGLLQASIPIEPGGYTNLTYDFLCNCGALKLSDERCFLQGKLQEGAASFKSGTIDGQIVANSTILSSKNKVSTKLDLNAPLSYLLKIFQIDLPYDGQCSIQLDLDLNNWNESLQGHCSIKDIYNNDYPEIKIEELKILFNKKKDIFKGTLILNHKGYEFLGNWTWNEKLESGNLYLDNSSILLLTTQYPWMIEPKNFFIKFNFNKNLNINGDFAFKAKNQKLEKKVNCKGNFNFIDNILKLRSDFEKNLLQLTCQFKPKFVINSLSLKDDSGKECISISTDLKNKPYSTKCLIYYQNIKNWFVDNLNPMLSGEGLIKLDGSFTDKGFEGKINLSQGSLKAANIHNIIKEIDGSVELNVKERSLTFTDLILNLNKGSIECKKGVIIFSDFQKPAFIHFPLIFKNCFLNWKNDFFSRISGRILLQKKLQGNMSLDGNLIIYNSQIKNNIFSKDFAKEFFGLSSSSSVVSSFDTDLNLSIISRNPIKIKTVFFESQANLNLNITKTILNTEISGQIELTGGSINFPYKPLNIVSGSINFINNSKDPLINLIAKNKIQKFIVTMQIIGSVNDPKIVLESSPVLSDEQIGALLLAGSEKASLNLVMPTLLLQNIKNIILGSSTTYSKVEKYLQKLLKPFKNVRILPTFTQEQGVGFQGAIEVDLTDRLRANIQKNFTSTEDTKLEVDYTLTDDVSLRGVKDEQGNLGGELEVRWKL